MERKEAIQRMQYLRGKNLHELAKLYGVTVRSHSGRLNKGWAGHVIERFLELPLNSAQSPNFGSWELKTIPLKQLRSGIWVFKETMAITMIDPINVCQKSFEDSHLLAKLKKAVVVVRKVGKTVDDPTTVCDIVEFDLKPSSVLYESVRRDYELVRQTLLDHNYDCSFLTGRMGIYIQPRTKGAGHGSTSRAFYARKLFLSQFINLSK